jgi:hypothetical protein
MEVIPSTSGPSFNVLAGKTMRHLYRITPCNPSKLSVLFLTLLLALPAYAYDFPLSEHAIRDAYFLGARQMSVGPAFLAQYTQTIPKLAVGDYKSTINVETPFTQVAVYASKQLNYGAQDAVKEFSGKPLVFRIHMDILYMLDAPPDAVQFKVIQNKKEIVPDSVERSAYFPASDKYTRPPAIGETIELEFNPSRLDSSELTIVIDTPDRQHAELDFDLRALR